jgi:hypothetical protein
LKPLLLRYSSGFCKTRIGISIESGNLIRRLLLSQFRLRGCQIRLRLPHVAFCIEL